MKKLRVLGCGDAFSSGGRFNTSFLIEGSESAVLVDCGATTMLRLRQMNYPIHKITQVIITHFHGDHFGGLPFFILNGTVNNEKPDSFELVGPPGIEDRVRGLQNTLYPETEKFIDQLGVRFIEYSSVWMDIGEMEIKGYRVVHSPPSNPHGIKLKWNEKSFAFSGDTEWTDELSELASGTELFILECNNLDKESPGHLSLKTINANRVRLPTRQLMFTHMGPEMLDAKNITVKRLQDGDVIDLW